MHTNTQQRRDHNCTWHHPVCRIWTWKHQFLDLSTGPIPGPPLPVCASASSDSATFHFVLATPCIKHFWTSHSSYLHSGESTSPPPQPSSHPACRPFVGSSPSSFLCLPPICGIEPNPSVCACLKSVGSSPILLSVLASNLSDQAQSFCLCLPKICRIKPNPSVCTCLRSADQTQSFCLYLPLFCRIKSPYSPHPIPAHLPNVCRIRSSILWDQGSLLPFCRIKYPSAVSPCLHSVGSSPHYSPCLHSVGSSPHYSPCLHSVGSSPHYSPCLHSVGSSPHHCACLRSAGISPLPPFFLPPFCRIKPPLRSVASIPFPPSPCLHSVDRIYRLYKGEMLKWEFVFPRKEKNAAPWIPLLRNAAPWRKSDIPNEKTLIIFASPPSPPASVVLKKFTKQNFLKLQMLHIKI